MAETEFSLPVPHIFEDGSVIDMTVHKCEEHDFITIRTDDVSVLIGTPDHARQIARALMVAADLWEKSK